MLLLAVGTIRKPSMSRCAISCCFLRGNILLQVVFVSGNEQRTDTWSPRDVGISIPLGALIVIER